jgi:hypothetical protein
VQKHVSVFTVVRCIYIIVIIIIVIIITDVVIIVTFDTLSVHIIILALGRRLSGPAMCIR